MEVGAWIFVIPKKKRIAVFCGSNKGVRPAYAEAAERLGELLAREKIKLVYGGGMVGQMGIVASISPGFFIRGRTIPFPDSGKWNSRVAGRQKFLSGSGPLREY